VSRIFISHSSTDNAPAIALRDWLVGEGWDDLFPDLDPERGIAAGERWERALNEAARRCEAVLFLISKAWLGSAWCKNELNLARRLNKRLFGILIEEEIGDLPADVTSKWQVIHPSPPAATANRPSCDDARHTGCRASGCEHFDRCPWIDVIGSHVTAHSPSRRRGE
jgi:TIR domain